LDASLIAAGADTTASFTQALVLALVNFPEVQRLAQEEIDRVVGDERAPLVHDIEDLPYIQAIIKEVSSQLYQSSAVEDNANIHPDYALATCRIDRDPSCFNTGCLLQGLRYSQGFDNNSKHMYDINSL
jgi:Cytochrome P450